MYQQIFEKFPDPILLVDQKGEILSANLAARTLFNYPQDEPAGRTFPFPLEDNSQVDLSMVLDDESFPPGTRLAEMRVVELEEQARPIYQVSLHDISDRLAAEERYQKAEETMRLTTQAFESTAEGIFIADAQSNIISINPAFTEITGYMPEEVLGRRVDQFHCEQSDIEFFLQMWNSLEVIGRWRGEIWNCRKNGEIYPELLTISTVKNEQGKLTHYIAVFTDITSRKDAEERLRYIATHDALTGLPNREFFHDQLKGAIATARRENHPLAVMLLDLDHFKKINDTLGHAKGDLILQAAADRLRACLTSNETVARQGGDEFTLLVEGYENQAYVNRIAMRIIASLSQPYQINHHTYQLTGSIGISLFPIHGEDADTLLKNADIAMYAAKQERNRYQYYVPEEVNSNHK